jgi:NAD(P)-dependent dehydrogenase (short-subunit alcohol dehydrogenase family)
MSNKSKQEAIIKNLEREGRGKLAVITGANSGIGFGAAWLLASAGVEVVMGCRNLEKGEIARSKILDDFSDARLHLIKIDVSDLASVKAFAGEFKSKFSKLDILINNAGIMMTPYSKTPDGFEKQFGTNHLGHFALVSHLMDIILSTSGSRIITISSIAHFKGVINFNNLNSENGYIRKVAYRQSKLANLLFAYELDRRFKAAGKNAMALSAHPGITSTNIVKLPGPVAKLKELVLMSTIKGSLPTMMAALDQNLVGGELIGPDGKWQMFGLPAVRRSSASSYDKDIWLRLWEVSEELTGVKIKI